MQSRKSIFQANEGDDPTIAAAEQANDESSREETSETAQPATDERGRVLLDLCRHQDQCEQQIDLRVVVIDRACPEMEEGGKGQHGQHHCR